LRLLALLLLLLLALVLALVLVLLVLRLLQQIGAVQPPLLRQLLVLALSHRRRLARLLLRLPAQCPQAQCLRVAW
jgi:hypothetical protein